MIVQDIWPDLLEVTGTGDEATNYRALSLGMDWLSNEKLFDPLIGYVDFTVDLGHTIALPREVKTPIKINLNNNPAFHRSRLWEFSANTDGSLADGVDGIGWTWENRGYAKVQDERPLPSKLRYVVDEAADAGKTVTIRFFDEDGRVHHETLTASDDLATATESVAMLHRIESVIREATIGDGYLIAEDDRTVARYYNDETQPQYRVIRLSQTGVAVRMMFRRHTPQVFSSLGDVIPFNSRLAIIWAAKTVRLLQGELYDKAAVAAGLAKEFAMKEQKAADEGEEVSAATEVSGARNANLNNLDGLIVADLYDEAAEIFGPIGREKLLDKMSMARDLLAKKGQWDCLVGNVDVWKPDTSEVVTPRQGVVGTGIFTLPRYVGSVLAVRPEAINCYARNGWFEFHLNGSGEQYRSDVGTWDLLGHACIIQELPRDPDTRKVIPVKLAAVCLESGDVGKAMRVYGLERLSDGRDVEVWRDGAEGYALTMALEPSAPAADAPNWTDIRRVKKDATAGFTKLVTVTAASVSEEQDDPLTVTLGPVQQVNGAGEIIYDPMDDAGPIPTVGDKLINYLDDEVTVSSETGFHGPFNGGSEDDLLIVCHSGDWPSTPEVTTTLRARLYSKFVAIGGVIFRSGDPGEITLDQDPPEDLAVGHALRIKGSFPGLLITQKIAAINGRVITLENVTPPAEIIGDTVYWERPRTTTITTTTVTLGTLMGYYYPDELEPRLMRIKVHTSKECRVTVRYKLRTARLSSLHDPLHLKSPLALIEAMRAIAKLRDDPAAATAHEANALRFLRENESSDHPTDAIRMQFDRQLTVGGFGNIV